VTEQRASLSDIYTPELVAQFPGIEEKINEFLGRYSGKVATPETKLSKVAKYSDALVEIARVVANGLKSIQRLQLPPALLFREAITPARKAGVSEPRDMTQRVGIAGRREKRYHVLDKDKKKPGEESNILFLLQRISKGTDTGPEYHLTGGIEVYLPLVDGIRFHVNDQVFKPKALEGVIKILPGDVHHHILPPKAKRHGPVRVLIIGGFGFKRGEKIPPKQVKKRIGEAKYQEINRFVKI